MQYFKRKIKYSVLTFFIIVLSLSISISTLAKTEVYFSQYDQPQKEIIKHINQAEAIINIAMYIFTDKEIALSLARARERGVNVRLYLDQDQVDYKYSQSRYLVQNGMNIRISTNNYIMHNKFAIIDNRILLTGSYNWTFSAHARNDENLMVIDDSYIISSFQNYFEKLWFNKSSTQRTRALYESAKKEFPVVLNLDENKESQTININTATQTELVKVLKINELLAQKIINLRNKLSCIKEPKDLLQIPELTNIDLREWEEEGINIIL